MTKWRGLAAAAALCLPPTSAVGQGGDMEPARGGENLRQSLSRDRVHELHPRGGVERVLSDWPS